MLSQLRLTNTENLSDAYSVFKEEPTHLLYLDISKKLKERTAAYLTLTEKLFNVLTARQRMRKIDILKTTVHHGFRSLLEAFKKDFPDAGIQVDFSTS